jgi:hypothetical protein
MGLNGEGIQGIGDRDVDLEDITADSITVGQGTASSPAVAFGDGDTGFFESGDDTLQVSFGGSAKWEFSSVLMGTSNSTRSGFINESASATNPNILPRQDDLNTGIGGPAADQLSLIAGGKEAIRIDVTGNHHVNSLLDAATGNEVALDLQYTTNKASSGDDTGLVVNQTDTLSPGTSLLADFQVGGSTKFSVDNAGALTLATYTRHHDITASSATLGPTAPSNEVIGVASGLGFNADAEVAYFNVEVPSEWIGTTDMVLLIDWAPDTAPSAGETVKWDISYRTVATGEDIDATGATTGTVTYTQSGGGTAGELIKSSITLTYNDGTNPLTVGDMIFVQFDRDVGTDSYDEIPVVFNWNLEYDANTIATH